jgi:hypothetical protein
MSFERKLHQSFNETDTMLLSKILGTGLGLC